MTEEDDIARNVYRLLLCSACCVALIWIGFIVSIIAILAVNDTHEIRDNCRGLVDFTIVSLTTPILFPAAFYCFIRPFNASLLACIVFLTACVRMIMESSSSPRCMESLGEPPLLLHLLSVKAIMYAFGVLSSIVAMCDRLRSDETRV
jgi:hypothetical protein